MVFTVTIQGSKEAISFLTAFPNKYKTNRQNAHRQIATNGVNTLKKNAHRITGKMMNSIKEGQVDANICEVVASIGYSGYENNRGGNHAFFTNGVKTITTDAQKWERSAISQSLGR